MNNMPVPLPGGVAISMLRGSFETVYFYWLVITIFFSKKPWIITFIFLLVHKKALWCLILV
jgi:hypothetical protein